MPEDAKLLPPIRRINDRLTALSREQRRLRALLALAVEARTDAETYSSKRRNPRPAAERELAQ